MENLIDITNTQAMIPALEVNYKPSLLFTRTFFPTHQTFATEEVIMDYRKGARKMAPFVVPGSGVNMARTGFKTNKYKPPMIAPQRPLNVADLEKRAFGEDVFSTQTPAERAASILAKDQLELTDAIDRRIEWMCVNALLYGTFEAKGKADDGGDEVIDSITFQDFTQKQTLTGTDMWTATDTADIYGQIKDIRKTMVRNSGNAPTLMVGNSTTMQYIVKNKSLLGILMIPNGPTMANFVNITPQIIGNDITREAQITGLNIQAYSYDGVYEDDDGTTKEYLPDGYVIFSRPNIGSLLCGMITQLEKGTWNSYAGIYVPKFWDVEGSDVQMYRIASRSVPLPANMDDWYVLKAF